MKYYKFLDDRDTGGYSSVPWNLPRGGHPGKWMPRITELRMCGRGYHVLEPQYLSSQFLQYNLYEVEVRGHRLWGCDKICVSQARLIRRLKGWSDESVALFAIDCAIRALKRVPTHRNNPKLMIIAARDCLKGRITRCELEAIVEGVNGIGPNHAALSSWDAAQCVVLCNHIKYAVWATLHDAHEGHGEREWQSKRILKYANGTATPLRIPK